MNENETNEQTSVAVAETNEVALKRPSVTEFCLIVNKSKDRKDALKRFKEAGFAMTYAALTGRLKQYKEKKVNVKQFEGRGSRKIDVDAVNAEIEKAQAEQETADQIVNGSESEATASA